MFIKPLELKNITLIFIFLNGLVFAQTSVSVMNFRNMERSRIEVNHKYQTLAFYNDSIPYYKSVEIPFENGKSTLKVELDSTTVISLNFGPSRNAYILERGGELNVEGDEDANIRGTKSNADGLRFLSHEYALMKPMVFGRELFQHATAEKMIYFFEYELDKQIRNPLNRLLRQGKIDSAYYGEILKLTEFRWVRAILLNISLEDTNFAQTSFIKYLFEKYDPFDKVYNNLPASLRLAQIRSKAFFISLGKMQGEKFDDGLWNEKDNVFHYVPRYLQPMLAYDQMVYQHEEDRYDYEYTKLIWENFQKLHPNHPKIPQLRRMFYRLEMENTP